MSRQADKFKVKRYTVALNERDMRRLTAYAAACGADRPTALARLIKNSLRDVKVSLSDDGSDSNQLRLFDSVQIDIFNNTTKVTGKE